MSENLLRNPSFEDGWTDQWYYSRYAQVPKGWKINVAAIDTDLLSKGAYSGIDHDPVLEVVKTIPEILHKPYYLLPPEERLGGSRALILHGETTFKLFSNYSPWSATLWQVLQNLTPGATVALTVPVQVHYNPKPGGDGSPGACAFRAFCGSTDGAWLTFVHGLDDRQWSTATLHARVPATGNLTVGATFESRSEAGIDFFTDAWSLVYIDEPDEPDKPECPGPRIDYVRRYNVYPGAATEARRREIAEIAVVERQQTCGPSYDDAGYGAGVLSDVTAVLWDIPEEERSSYLDFYRQFYPGTIVEFEGEGGTAPPPPPPPPPSGEPTPYKLRSNNYMGLHSGRVREMSWPYIEQSGVNLQKFFSAGDAYQASQRAPGIVSVWRKYIGNEEGELYAYPDLRTAALSFLDKYTLEIATAARNLGISEDQLLSGITAIESLNETIPTFNEAHTRRAVEYDCWFAEEAYKRWGDKVQTVLLNVAIGNPHETEVPLLLPAAQAVHKYGGFLGYHPYYTANETHDWLGEYWQWHAGRWQEWDKYFVSQGVYPRYSLGESGIVYAWDGVSFNSGLGWKACGSFERYLPLIAEFNRRVIAWNAEHANRCAGTAIFGYGNWEWDNFELGNGEVRLLLNWSQTL